MITGSIDEERERERFLQRVQCYPPKKRRDNAPILRKFYSHKLRVAERIALKENSHSGYQSPKMENKGNEGRENRRAVRKRKKRVHAGKFEINIIADGRREFSFFRVSNVADW